MAASEFVINYANRGLSALPSLPDRVDSLLAAHNKLCLLDALAAWVGAAELRQLDLEDNRVVGITAISACVSLEVLNLADNFVTERSLAGLSPLTALRLLQLRGNALQSFALRGGFERLQTLDLRGNHIRELPNLSNLPNLRVCLFDGNEIATGSLPISAFENRLRNSTLTHISCSGNAISSLAVFRAGLLPALTHLEADGIGLESARDLANISSGLQLLSLCNNSLTSCNSALGLHVDAALDATRSHAMGASLRSSATDARRGALVFPVLDTLRIFGNNLQNLDGFSNCRQLRRIYASFNQLTGVPQLLPHFNNLAILDVSFNRLTDEHISGLKHLNRLRAVRARGNDIRYVTSVTASLGQDTHPLLQEVDFAENPMTARFYPELGAEGRALPIIGKDVHSQLQLSAISAAAASVDAWVSYPPAYLMLMQMVRPCEPLASPGRDEESGLEEMATALPTLDQLDQLWYPTTQDVAVERISYRSLVILSLSAQLCIMDGVQVDERERVMALELAGLAVPAKETPPKLPENAGDRSHTSFRGEVSVLSPARGAMASTNPAVQATCADQAPPVAPIDTLKGVGSHLKRSKAPSDGARSLIGGKARTASASTHQEKPRRRNDSNKRMSSNASVRIKSAAPSRRTSVELGGDTNRGTFRDFLQSVRSNTGARSDPEPIVLFKELPFSKAENSDRETPSRDMDAPLATSHVPQQETNRLFAGEAVPLATMYKMREFSGTQAADALSDTCPISSSMTAVESPSPGKIVAVSPIAPAPSPPAAQLTAPFEARASTPPRRPSPAPHDTDRFRSPSSTKRGHSTQAPELPPFQLAQDPLTHVHDAKPDPASLPVAGCYSSMRSPIEKSRGYALSEVDLGVQDAKTAALTTPFAKQLAIDDTSAFVTESRAAFTPKQRAADTPFYPRTDPTMRDPDLIASTGHRLVPMLKGSIINISPPKSGRSSDDTYRRNRAKACPPSRGKSVRWASTSASARSRSESYGIYDETKHGAPSDTRKRGRSSASKVVVGSISGTPLGTSRSADLVMSQGAPTRLRMEHTISIGREPEPLRDEHEDARLATDKKLTPEDLGATWRQVPIMMLGQERFGSHQEATIERGAGIDGARVLRHSTPLDYHTTPLENVPLRGYDDTTMAHEAPSRFVHPSQQLEMRASGLRPEIMTDMWSPRRAELHRLAQSLRADEWHRFGDDEGTFGYASPITAAAPGVNAHARSNAIAQTVTMEPSSPHYDYLNETYRPPQSTSQASLPPFHAPADPSIEVHPSFHTRVRLGNTSMPMAQVLPISPTASGVAAGAEYMLGSRLPSHLRGTPVHSDRITTTTAGWLMDAGQQRLPSNDVQDELGRLRVSAAGQQRLPGNDVQDEQEGERMRVDQRLGFSDSISDSVHMPPRELIATPRAAGATPAVAISQQALPGNLSRWSNRADLPAFSITPRDAISPEQQLAYDAPRHVDSSQLPSNSPHPANLQHGHLHPGVSAEPTGSLHPHPSFRHESPSQPMAPHAAASQLPSHTSQKARPVHFSMQELSNAMIPPAVTSERDFPRTSRENDKATGVVNPPIAVISDAVPASTMSPNTASHMTTQLHRSLLPPTPAAALRSVRSWHAGSPSRSHAEQLLTLPASSVHQGTVSSTPRFYPSPSLEVGSSVSNDRPSQQGDSTTLRPPVETDRHRAGHLQPATLASGSIMAPSYATYQGQPILSAAANTGVPAPSFQAGRLVARSFTLNEQHGMVRPPMLPQTSQADGAVNMSTNLSMRSAPMDRLRTTASSPSLVANWELTEDYEALRQTTNSVPQVERVTSPLHSTATHLPNETYNLDGQPERTQPRSLSRRGRDRLATQLSFADAAARTRSRLWEAWRLGGEAGSPHRPSVINSVRTMSQGRAAKASAALSEAINRTLATVHLHSNVSYAPSHPAASSEISVQVPQAKVEAASPLSLPVAQASANKKPMSRPEKTLQAIREQGRTRRADAEVKTARVSLSPESNGPKRSPSLRKARSTSAAKRSIMYDVRPGGLAFTAETPPPEIGPPSPTITVTVGEAENGAESQVQVHLSPEWSTDEVSNVHRNIRMSVRDGSIAINGTAANTVISPAWSTKPSLQRKLLASPDDSAPGVVDPLIAERILLAQQLDRGDVARTVERRGPMQNISLTLSQAAPVNARLQTTVTAPDDTMASRVTHVSPVRTTLLPPRTLENSVILPHPHHSEVMTSPVASGLATAVDDNAVRGHYHGLSTNSCFACEEVYRASRKAPTPKPVETNASIFVSNPAGSTQNVRLRQAEESHLRRMQRSRSRSQESTFNRSTIRLNREAGRKYEVTLGLQDTKLVDRTISGQTAIQYSILPLQSASVVATPAHNDAHLPFATATRAAHHLAKAVSSVEGAPTPSQEGSASQLMAIPDVDTVRRKLHEVAMATSQSNSVVMSRKITSPTVTVHVAMDNKPKTMDHVAIASMKATKQSKGDLMTSIQTKMDKILYDIDSSLARLNLKPSST